MNAARRSLHAVNHHTFTRWDIGDFLCELTRARPNFNVIREAVHRNQVREGPLDYGYQDVLAARRWRDTIEDRGLADHRLASGRHINRGYLAGEVILEKRIVVRRLQHIFEGRSGRGLTNALLNVRASRNSRRGGRWATRRNHQRANQSLIVMQPIARITCRGIQAIGAGDELGFPSRHLSNPKLNAGRLGVEKRKMISVRRKVNVRKVCLRRHRHFDFAAV